MRPRDVLSYSFSAIRLRKLRAGLTTLGVVIGIAAIVALLSVTQGLQTVITRELQSGFATDTLIVTTRGGGGAFGLGGGGGGNSGFSLFVSNTSDIDKLSGVRTSLAIIQRGGFGSFISCGNETMGATLVGVDFAGYADVYGSTFVAGTGEVPTNPSNETIVIGNRVSDPGQNGTLFCTAGDQAQIIWTSAAVLPPVNMTYNASVAGVLKPIGGLGIGPSDMGVYMPIEQAESFFNTNEADLIIVKLTDDSNATITSATSAIKDLFSNQVSVTSATAVLNILGNVFSVIQLFLGGIAAISLLVAGIGIMNIMIVSLMERTREIGILKALGMKNRTVLSVFLSESIIIGLMGAIIGIVSGWILANIVALVFRGGALINAGTQGGGTPPTQIVITPILTPEVLVLALVFGVGVSTVFALYPAWRASRLKPVEALRYE